jgi:hypothetical protein
MSYNTDLQTNNTSLQEILATIESLPEASNAGNTYKYILVNCVRFMRDINIIRMGNAALDSAATGIVVQSKLSPSPQSFPNGILTRGFTTNHYCLENSFIIVFSDNAFATEVSGGITEIYASSDSTLKIYHIPSIVDDNTTEQPTINFLD